MVAGVKNDIDAHGVGYEKGLNLGELPFGNYQNPGHFRVGIGEGAL